MAVEIVDVYHLHCTHGLGTITLAVEFGSVYDTAGTVSYRVQERVVFAVVASLARLEFARKR